MLDKVDWLEINKRVRTERVREREPDLRLAVQREVPAKLLTGDPNWDFYCSLLQAKIDDADESLLRLKESLADPQKVDHQELILLKMHIAAEASYVRALREAIELPVDIANGGKKAREILKDHGL